MQGRLVDLLARVERVAVAPHEIDAGWYRWVGGVYRLFGWQARLESRSLDLLFEALSSRAATPRVEASIELALVELEENVALCEKAAAVYGRVPTAHTAWLYRVLRVIARVQASRSLPQGDPGRRVARAVDPVMLLPPLSIDLGAAGAEPAQEERDSPNEEAAEDPALPSRARLVELQLTAIDHVMEAARAEKSVLARRRRLLEAARRLLLEAAAALPLDARGTTERLRYLAHEIVDIDRLQAAGLEAEVALLHQARGALSRGDRDRLVASLTALDTFAVRSGDVATLQHTAHALDALWDGLDPAAIELREASVQRSSRELLGGRALDRILAGYGAARERFAENPSPDQRETFRLAREYLAPGAEAAALTALIAVDGCFDAGSALSPVRVEEIEHRARIVSHPTRDMLIVPARSVHDVQSAIISDPRSVLLDLAAGKLLSRKFAEVEVRRRVRVRLQGEVRIYLLDGSTSMMEEGRGGNRARMRDAVLLSELSTVLRRFEMPNRHTRVVLFYRYFTKRLGPLVRVDTGDKALAAMGDVVGKVREGGTDIERALRSSFRLVAKAERRDPDLARAHIVLVTDGRAVVREEVIAKERALASVPIGVSVIALGHENPTLQALVAHQRAAGERAFYHFMSDDALGAVLEGTSRARALHLPEAGGADVDVVASLRDTIEELCALDRRGPVPPAPHDGDEIERAAHRELGLEPPVPEEGEAARRDAIARDGRAVQLRFDRWFPDLAVEGAAPASAEPDADLDATLVVLGTVAEIVGEFGGRSLERCADAIELIERLLPDAQLSPARYHAVIAEHGPRVAPYLAAVRKATTLA